MGYWGKGGGKGVCWPPSKMIIIQNFGDYICKALLEYVIRRLILLQRKKRNVFKNSSNTVYGVDFSRKNTSTERNN